MKETKSKKVIVAMSGGVDSSVAAALLKKASFDVIGIHMKFWAESDGKANRCCTVESEKMARLVAKKIGIPFYVLNLKKEFKKFVVDYFISASKQGLTPNPCVACNKEIKFGLLLKKARALGADFIATGHYAIVEDGKLFKGSDEHKDQSYFLWRLNKDILKHVIFPIGGYMKEEVRVLAKEFKLPTANTPESQEVCFVSGTVGDFLNKYIKIEPGKIVDTKRDKIGEHDGLSSYTMGQRKGIGLPGGPYFVLRKDLKKNELIVTKNEKDLFSRELSIKNVNWLDNVKLPTRVTAKVRYGSKGSLATVKKESGKIMVIFSKPQRAITPGQSVVFYKGKQLIGGGIIV